MSISDIQDIQKIIKSYILTTPLSDYKKILFFPSEIEKIIFSYNPVTSFYQLLINNETSIPDFNYKNFNYLELSKNPNTYHFIKYLLRDIDPINDFEVIEEFKKISNNDRIPPHEYRLFIALSNIKPSTSNYYAEFWNNINKYDSDFSILGDEKNYKHINFSNFSINKYIINIIEKKFFNKVSDVNLDKVTEFLLTYNIKINKEKLLLILSKCNNENIINFIKYCIDEKKIILDYDFLINLSSSKNSLIHDMIYDTLKLEKKKLKKKFVNPFVDILLHNGSIPDKIFDIEMIIEENDKVMIYSTMKFTPEHAGLRIVHIFRFLEIIPMKM